MKQLHANHAVSSATMYNRSVAISCSTSHIFSALNTTDITCVQHIKSSFQVDLTIPFLVKLAKESTHMYINISHCKLDSLITHIKTENEKNFDTCLRDPWILFISIFLLFQNREVKLRFTISIGPQHKAKGLEYYLQSSSVVHDCS
jgi:hypothetical protein